MKKELSIQDLESQRDQLLRALRLPDRAKAGTLPESVQSVDLKDLIKMMERISSASGPLAPVPEISEFFTDFIQRSEEGLRACLQSDIDLLSRVKKTAADHVQHTAFGMLEAVFPVRFSGEVVHCLWCGKFRDKPFSRPEIEEISRISGSSPDRIAAAAGDIPIMSASYLQVVMELARVLRDSLEQSLWSRVQAGHMSQQLLQSERTRSLGTLSGGVAHHFNNLLSVILGYSSFVLNREEHSKEAASALRKISEAAQRGRRLTEEILAFAGAELEEEAPCSIHDIVTSVLSLLESQCTPRIRVKTQLDAQQNSVQAQPSSLHQIIFNLLSNAIDSILAGGALNIVTSNVALAAEGGKKNYLKLEVTDSSGVLPQGFTKGDTNYQPEKEVAVGDRAALKLTSVYGMVSRLAGTLTVTNEPGTMTRVEVLLPVASAEKEAPAEKKFRRRLAPSTIWVVDDDPIFREMCNQVLTDDGHSVQDFPGGREMMDRWPGKNAHPDLMIIDFSMPEFNGLEICEWLREKGARMPIVLVSGFAANQPDIKKAMRMRKTYFLQKPFTSRDLADTVTVALGETLIGE